MRKERLITREYQFPRGRGDSEDKRQRCTREMRTRQLSKTNSIPYCGLRDCNTDGVEHMVGNETCRCQQLSDLSCYYTQSVPRQITTHFVLTVES